MRVAILGCGNMGSAIAHRLKENTLFLYDQNLEKAEELEHCGKVCREYKEALVADVIILAVKPQNLNEIADLIKEDLTEDHTVVSLLAGTSIANLKSHFPKVELVRMMPNIPLLYGEGVIGLTSTNERLKKLFVPLGKYFWMPEEKMDALTSLTGSGPAFFFKKVEAMIDSGVLMGFTKEESKDLVHQMLKGSLTYLEKSEKSPGELVERIASPQGTTVAGLKIIEEVQLKRSIIDAFLAAFKRAKELN